MSALRKLLRDACAEISEKSSVGIVPQTQQKKPMKTWAFFN
jgi:hypothetical protein